MRSSSVFLGMGKQTSPEKQGDEMKLYIYSLESNQHVATIVGNSNQECETKANEEYCSNDYGWNYSPAFEIRDGLVENMEAEEIEA